MNNYEHIKKGKTQTPQKYFRSY